MLIFSADTGKGKSTMIPRLILYYISCMNNCTSRIACSQPTLKALQSILRIRKPIDVDYENINKKYITDYPFLLDNPILSRRKGFTDEP